MTTLNATSVDLRDVMAVALDSFRENGYRHYGITYNLLLQRYGSFLFSHTGFCRKLEEMLSNDVRAPYSWVETILTAWIEDRTLMHAGFRYLVNRDEDNWWK